MKSDPNDFVTSDWWTTEGVLDKTAAWEGALQSCYLDWKLIKPVPNDFHARIRKRNLAEICLVECVCGPCAGHRQPQGSSKDTKPYVGIQIVLNGTECFEMSGKTITIGSGDIVFWNSCEETQFEVQTELHKVTLLMPQALLDSRLELGQLIKGGIIEKKTATGSLLYSYIQALAQHFDTISEQEVHGVKWTSIELGAAAASWLQQPMSSPSQIHTRRLQEYILENLQDPDLTVEQIAAEIGISIRYVHSLFSSLDTTVSRWIMERRLERCRDCLSARPDGRGIVKDVALQWGFSDAGHFSRVFKKRYGLTPMEYWEQQNKKS